MSERDTVASGKTRTSRMERERRRADALRQNLRRRKTQAHLRRTGEGGQTESQEDGSSGSGAGL